MQTANQSHFVFRRSHHLNHKLSLSNSQHLPWLTLLKSYSLKFPFSAESYQKVIMEFIATPEDLEEDNIWVAVSNGNITRVQAILATGVLANVQDEHGYSPL